MKFYWVKTNRLIKRIFARYVWEVDDSNRTVYLTFDDGPTPDVTDWVLDVLGTHQIKATFFCIGNNITDNPDLFRRIVREGHAIGNHTYNHLNGWKTANDTYMENISRCQKILEENSPLPGRLFRPPYGKIKRAQATEVLKRGYKIIMWDVLTVDYDKEVSPKKCVENATRRTTSGSILIFHDSLKARVNLQIALPETIRILKEKGFRFGILS
ncbi:polysaccharide deacetylase family protein [Flavobacterium magnum]|uniref:Polysaccharide deacetylase family protein n=1 Tax=Flavobacterium magnum TaxID=2162713 RepID=A0A2S0RBY5_9FLAO|nr:polysaccharide deacetylase family protein [Flavobacterium magnum]AWA29517.1 polysaccharide deacetylase family protein [Flavobacterium magnum]